jgi:hypothetical protein
MIGLGIMGSGIGKKLISKGLNFAGKPKNKEKIFGKLDLFTNKLKDKFGEVTSQTMDDGSLPYQDKTKGEWVTNKEQEERDAEEKKKKNTMYMIFGGILLLVIFMFKKK